MQIEVGRIKGKKPKLINTETCVAKPQLVPEDGTPAPLYQYLQRIHSRDNVAYAIVKIYLDKSIYDLRPRLFNREMVIPNLSKISQTKVSRIKQTFSFTTADSVTAALLDIAVNSPIGEVRRVITNSEGLILYVGEAKYRGDFVKIEMDIEV